MSIKARDAGADGLLCVTPYYNKCTQKGLIESFTKIADATELPMIVYNVPGRTGVNIKPATYEKLADHAKIVGIKEANGDISSVVDTMSRCGHKIDMYSGNDDQIVPILSMGGIGCISPIKAAMAAAGLCDGYARLPLTPMEEPARQHLLACMREVGLDV